MSRLLNFTQELVASGEGEGGEPIGPAVGYDVGCSAQFSGSWSMNDGAPVEGTSPAEADRASAEEALAED